MPPKIRVLQCLVESDEVYRETFERVRNRAKRQKMFRRWGTVVAHRHVVCEQRLLEIIRQIDWENGKEGRIIRRYAKCCIYCWNVDWLFPEPQDLVNEALCRCISDDRKFHYPTRRGFPDFFCYTMKSIARDEKEKARRHGDQSIMEEIEVDSDQPRRTQARLPIAPDADTEPVAHLMAASLLGAFLDSIEDLDLKTYVQQRRDHPDWTADDHAHAIGVDIQEIYNLNRRLHRLRERWFRLGGSPPPPQRPRPRRRG